jgi:hypothetical protein
LIADRPYLAGQFKELLLKLDGVADWTDYPAKPFPGDALALAEQLEWLAILLRADDDVPGRVVRPSVIWMRHRRSAIAHAFAETDVTARLNPLVPIMNCDRYQFADVLRDDLAERCAACVRAAKAVGQ